MVNQPLTNPFEQMPLHTNEQYMQNINEASLNRGVSDATQNLYTKSGKIAHDIRQKWFHPEALSQNYSWSARIDNPTVDPGNPLDPTHPRDRYPTSTPIYLQSYGSVKQTGIDTSSQGLPQSRFEYPQNGGGFPSPDVPPSNIPPFNGNGKGIETNATSKPTHSESIHFPPQPSYGKEAGQSRVSRQSPVSEQPANIPNANNSDRTWQQLASFDNKSGAADTRDIQHEQGKNPMNGETTLTENRGVKNRQENNDTSAPHDRLEATPTSAGGNKKTAEPEQVAGDIKNTAQLASNKTPSQVGAGENTVSLPTEEMAALTAPKTDTKDDIDYVDRRDKQGNPNATMAV